MDDDKWVEKQEAIIKRGETIVQEASNEALEYVSMAIENLEDRQWRKMTVESQALEMGVGKAIAEALVPKIYQDMTKKMARKLGIPKELSRALQHIYIGRTMRTILKEVEKEKSGERD